MVAAGQSRARLARMLPLTLVLLGGCCSLPPAAPVDLSGPGWSVREGQAVWKPEAGAAGVAGELLVATHDDGRQVVRFTKTPLPFLDARRTTNTWQLQVVSKRRIYRGRGEPPARLFWLHLPAALAGRPVPAGWRFQAGPDSHWRFEHPRTGESLAGFLEPAAPRP